MKETRKKSARGATLMETVICVGVLAVAVPLTFAAIGESGKSGQASGAETRAPWVAAVTFDELRAAANGRSAYFTVGDDGVVRPPADGVWALGFSRGGGIVARLSDEDYAKGLRKSGDREVSFIARIHPAETGTGPVSPTSVPAMRVVVEYPAPMPADRRRTVAFHANLR